MITVPLVAVMLLTGLLVGTVNGALGIGGGILMVPALREFVPGMDALTAKGTSLFVIIFVSAVNAWHQNKERRSSWRVAGLLAAGSIAGGYCGAWFAGLLPDAAVTWVFVGFLAVLAARLLLMPEPRQALDAHGWKRDGLAAGIGAVTGVVSGMTGIGGGLVLVPLVLIAGLASNKGVTALSNLVMVATCAAAASVQLRAEATLGLPATVGQVSLALAPLLFLGALVGAPAGRWVNRRLSYRQRRTCLLALLAIITVRMVGHAVR